MNNLHKFHRTYARFNRKRWMHLAFLRRQWRRTDEAPMTLSSYTSLLLALGTGCAAALMIALAGCMSPDRKAAKAVARVDAARSGVPPRR